MKRLRNYADICILTAAAVILFLLGVLMVTHFLAASTERAIVTVKSAWFGIASSENVSENSSWLDDPSIGREIRRNSAGTLSNQPEVFIHIEDPKQAEHLLANSLYVKAFSLSDYDQKAVSWNSGVRDTVVKIPVLNQWTEVSRPTRNLNPVIRYKVTYAGALKASQRLVVGLPNLRRLQLEQVFSPREGLLMTRAAEIERPIHFLAESAPISLENIPSSYRQTIRLDLPETPKKVKDLTAQIVSNEMSTVQKLETIKRHLQQGYAYSLKKVKTESEDPLAEFLFSNKEGHCELFATAGALMARAIGVASRIAYGWAGGDYHADENTFVFRSKQAHAWVEIFLNDYGWVTMDPSGSDGEAGTKPRKAHEDETVPPSTALKEIKLAEGGFKMLTGKQWSVVAILVGSICILLIIRFFLRNKNGFSYQQGTHERESKASYTQAWEKALAMRGIMPRQHLTMRQQIAALGEEGPKFAPELLHYHYTVRYESARPDFQLEEKFREEIEVWNREFD